MTIYPGVRTLFAEKDPYKAQAKHGQLSSEEKSQAAKLSSHNWGNTFNLDWKVRLSNYMPEKVKDYQLVASGVGLFNNDQYHINAQSSLILNSMTAEEKRLNNIINSGNCAEIEKNFPGFRFKS